ncbi:MAG: ABC transporter ATP-binding protein [Oscillospiraceae bacterium]|nr:ABC transporter ATP-binding protein [Oscillospiraceae bacterium]
MSDLLRVEKLCKSFSGHTVFKDVNCHIKAGEFISLLGPSGCGKTTFLRCVIGLIPPDSGRIFLEGEDITELRTDKRGFSIVFQDYALFPHMTLYDNVAYPLKLKKLPKKQLHERVMDALSSLGIQDAAKKHPAQLSGGMQQRAAIARSLVMGSRLMLLDEPFSALDAMVKVDLSDELKSLQKQFNITMIMVTHDQIDAISLSDRIMLMDGGRIVADDVPENLYKNYDDEFVKTFFVDQIDKRARHIVTLRN